jgi:hypothetical protein
MTPRYEWNKLARFHHVGCKLIIKPGEEIKQIEIKYKCILDSLSIVPFSEVNFDKLRTKYLRITSAQMNINAGTAT